MCRLTPKRFKPSFAIVLGPFSFHKPVNERSIKKIFQKFDKEFPSLNQSCYLIFFNMLNIKLNLFIESKLVNEIQINIKNVE